MIDEFGNDEFIPELVVDLEKNSKYAIIATTGIISIMTRLDLVKITDSLIKEGIVYLLFDMKNLEFIDSSGLGYFMKLYTEINAKKGKILIFNLKPHLVDLFKRSFGPKANSILCSDKGEAFSKLV